MQDLKTVEGSSEVIIQDPLLAKQREGVARMRASLLACNEDVNPTTVVTQITAQRVIHQLSRIVRYTELMDKIEEALYDSMDATLASIGALPGPASTNALLVLQERLQNNMIASHKILEPYLGMVSDIDAIPEPIDADNLYDATARDRIRTAAQMVLADLAGGVEDADI